VLQVNSGHCTCPKSKPQPALTGNSNSQQKVTDINEIMKFGVMLTPGIAVDGEVKSSGKVPGVEAIKPWLA